MNRQLFLIPLFFIGLGVFFLHKAILGSEIALPGDVLIGHYYPWRDYVWDGRESGYPIKNFDLNDAVVQFFPWRKFSVEQISAGVIPFRNPYNFLGTPHLANVATAVFYPLSIVFYVLPFFTAWDIFIVLQIILAGFFMYLYLNNLKLGNLTALYGGVTFALSSLIVTTLEFGVIGHTVLWAPLILYSIDKLLETQKARYLVIGTFAIFCLALAGFVQMAIYVYTLALVYFLFRAKRRDYIYLGLFIFPFLLAGFQLLPFAQTAVGSSRIAGYFADFSDARKYLMPVNRLVGAIIPDFYGSPATGNFFGGISYTEFAFYLGIPVVIFSLFALSLKQKSFQIKFWALALGLSLVLTLSNPISRLIHSLNIPIYSSLLPSRLLSIITICLVVLSALGISEFQKHLHKNTKEVKKLVKVVALVFFVFIFFALDALVLYRLDPGKGAVSLRNIVVPFFVFVITAISFIFARVNFKIWMYFLILVTLVDLTRQGWKYNTFIDESLVFPKTGSLEFLESQKVPPRVVMKHQELLPAEANVYYGFSLLGGYDSVHSAKTEKLLNTLNYQDVNSERVSGRVVFVSSLTSRSYDILSPDYYLVLNDNHEKIGNNMELVFSEGRTELYRNLDSFERAYVASHIEKVSEGEALSKVLAMAMTRQKVAYVTEDIGIADVDGQGAAELISDKVNELAVSIDTNSEAVIVVNEAFDKSWTAMNSATGEEVDLFEVNYNLIGFVAPPGNYDVKFTYSPKSFFTGVDVSLASLFVFVGYLVSFRSFRSRFRRL